MMRNNEYNIYVYKIMLYMCLPRFYVMSLVSPSVCECSSRTTHWGRWSTKQTWAT